MNATRLLLLGGAAAAVLATCSSADRAKILKTGGDIAATATGDESFSRLGESGARTVQSYEDFLPSEEHVIGRTVGAQILANPRYPLLADEKVTRYVNDVGLSLALSSDAVRQTYKGYRFIVLDSDELNAFSAPGGFVFVTTGILRLTQNEEELAAILAHEIAHVTLKHGLQAIDQSHYVEIGQALTDVLKSQLLDKKDRKEVDAWLEKAAGVFGKATDEIVFTLVTGGYGAEDEHASDALAVKILEDAGYDPRGLSSFLGHMPHDAAAGGWLSTHPSAEERVKAVRPLETASAAADEGLAKRTARHAAALGSISP